MSTATKRSAASEAWELVNELVHSQRRAVMAIASELELSVPQTMAMRRLDPDHPMPMNSSRARCAATTRTSPGSSTARGPRLVRREPSANDRRVKMLTVTPEGEALRERLTLLWDRPPAALAELDADDQIALRDILQRALG